MEYVIIGACIVVAIAGGIVLYVKNKRTKNELGNTAVVVSKTSSSKLQASEVANDPVIQIGILPADAISDETKLVEITDSTAWHEGTADRLGIEADESRRKRAGFDGVIHFIPGLFNDNLNFRGIEEKTASMITAQKAGHVCTHKIDKSELSTSALSIPVMLLPIQKQQNGTADSQWARMPYHSRRIYCFLFI